MQYPVNFGVFLSPLHLVGEDPDSLMARDYNLGRFADELGFDEFWVGEHHSAGNGTIGSPDLFLAALSKETRSIKLGTGVWSIPYHNPFHVAERAAFLSHLTRGRFILGMGAGSVAGDMKMFGFDPSESRARLADGAEVVVSLLRGERVSRTLPWFDLRDAKLQIAPFDDSLEVVIASASTPAGVELAGRLQTSVLSHGAPPWGVVRPGKSLETRNLATQWSIFETAAEAVGYSPNRRHWRQSFPVHVSSSKDAAKAEVYAGWVRQRKELWIETFGIPMSRVESAHERAFEATLEGGGIILGSPQECAEQIRQLAAECGGFGKLLISHQDWASPADQFASLELFARFVRPLLTGSSKLLEESAEFAKQQRVALQSEFSAARQNAGLATPATTGAA